MRITITKQNISQYRDRTYTKVTEVEWKAGDLDGQVLHCFPELLKLDCTDNQLVSLEGIECCFPKLRKLDCSNNQLVSLKGIECCSQLRDLYCSGNQLVSLEGIEECPQLRVLFCGNNQLVSLACEVPAKECPLLWLLYCHNNDITSLEGIDRFPRLRALRCYDCRLASLEGADKCLHLDSINCTRNQLQSLHGIGHCLLLNDIDCTQNQLSSLAGLEHCPLLKKLYCGGNQLASLAGLEHNLELESITCPESNLVTLTGLRYPQLKRFYCYDNRLISLEGIDQCPQLEILNCRNNRLATLAGINMCPQLRELYCDGNQLVSLEHAVYLRNLRSLHYANNPLGIQTIQVQRFLNHIDRVKTNKSIYSDAQNVHNIHIQKTVCESIQRLLTDPKPEFSIETILESGLDEKAIRLLVEYCSDTCIHSHHLLTYQELLSYVWARVYRSEHRDELLKILAEQVCDSECKCFTGRFNRTISVLVGFYPDIVIEISDNSRIGAIIIATRDRIYPYDPVTHREVASRELIEAGYTLAEIESWLGAITEP